jgi:hypothetical protein
LTIYFKRTWDILPTWLKEILKLSALLIGITIIDIIFALIAGKSINKIIVNVSANLFGVYFLLKYFKLVTWFLDKRTESLIHKYKKIQLYRIGEEGDFIDQLFYQLNQFHNCFF